MEQQLDHDVAVKKTIVSLRKECFKGIHMASSGFNYAFKKYYDNENPIEVMNRLPKDGKIVLRPDKGGMMHYLPENAPAAAGKSAEETLKKMGL